MLWRLEIFTSGLRTHGLSLPPSARPSAECRVQIRSGRRIGEKPTCSLHRRERPAAHAAPAVGFSLGQWYGSHPAMLQELLGHSCSRGPPDRLLFLLFVKQSQRGDLLLIIHVITSSVSQTDPPTPFTSLPCAPGRAHMLPTCCWQVTAAES